MILAALCENPSITNDIFSFTFIINITKATYIIMYLQIWSLYFSYSNHYLSVSCIHLQILSVTENPREVESSIVFGQKCNQSPLTLSIVKTLQIFCYQFSSIFFMLLSIFCDFLQHVGQESVSINIHLLARALVFLSEFLKLQMYQTLFIQKKECVRRHIIKAVKF